MILAIEFTLGLSYLVIGLSCLLRPRAWLGWLDSMVEEGSRPEQTALVMGMVGLFICAFIVGGHPVFSGWPMLVTVIGILGILEGAVYLLCPGIFVAVMRWFSTKGRGWFRPLGVLAVALGAAILYIWAGGAGIV